MNPIVRPKLSIIIPVLNAAGILENCLRSIAAQDFPKESLEILVADGGSTDATGALAARYGGRILNNPLRVAESGKRLALAAAQGEFIVFLDADNELSHPDFLSLAVAALQQNPVAIGVECYYPASPKMGSFCAYLTETLHISDPVSWMMSVAPLKLGEAGEVERWGYPKDSLAYPLGANGFVFRKADLDLVGAAEYFEDTVMVLKLAQSGRREWLRLKGRGVHHYIVSGVAEFLQKRRRQTFHFLAQAKGELKHPSWTAANPRLPGWLACLACGSVLVPVVQMLVGLARTGDRRWLWHPLACFLSALGVGWGVVTFLTSKRNADREAGLQPKQTLPAKDS